MKQYHLLLLYNDKLKRREWLAQKKSECNSWEWRNKSNELILNYNFDIFTFPDASNGCQVVWKVVQYEPNLNIDRRWVWRFAAHQFYYIEYLDGVFASHDIMFLMSRTRGGVEEMSLYISCGVVLYLISLHANPVGHKQYNILPSLRNYQLLI